MDLPAAKAKSSPWMKIAFWIVLFVTALFLDEFIANCFAPNYKYFKHHSKLAEEGKEMGEYWMTACISVVLITLHARRWWAAALLLTSGAIGGGFEALFKWIAGRGRPIRDDVLVIEPFSFDFFRGGLAGIVHQKNLCFPSGHATLAFATAACLSYLCPRGTIVWFAAAVLVGLQRMAELAHYPSDIVAGGAFGVLSFHLARLLFQKLAPQSQLQTASAST